MDSIIVNKVASLERCLKRVEGTYASNKQTFDTDHDAQDIIVLNLQRACQLAIDLGMHVVRVKKLGLPKESKEVFSLLAEAKLLSKAGAEALQKMVGFRNVAVHEYNDINYDIVRKIVENHLQEFQTFCQKMLQV